MSFHTIKEVEANLGPIAKVEQHNRWVVITLDRSFPRDRRCSECKGGKHEGITASPRIKIRSF